MKLITLDTILWSLENMTNVIKVPEPIRVKARRAVDRMLEIA
jgi:quinolinate synthase